MALRLREQGGKWRKARPAAWTGAVASVCSRAGVKYINRVVSNHGGTLTGRRVPSSPVPGALADSPGRAAVARADLRACLPPAHRERDSVLGRVNGAWLLWVAGTQSPSVAGSRRLRHRRLALRRVAVSELAGRVRAEIVGRLSRCLGLSAW